MCTLKTKSSTSPEPIYHINMTRIRIRMTMDNEPKHLNSFFISNDLNVTLYVVYGTSWHFDPREVASI